MYWAVQKLGQTGTLNPEVAASCWVILTVLWNMAVTGLGSNWGQWVCFKWIKGHWKWDLMNQWDGSEQRGRYCNYFKCVEFLNEFIVKWELGRRTKNLNLDLLWSLTTYVLVTLDAPEHWSLPLEGRSAEGNQWTQCGEVVNQKSCRATAMRRAEWLFHLSGVPE